MGIYTRMRSNSSPAQVVYEYQITLDHGNTFGSGIRLYLLLPLNRQEAYGSSLILIEDLDDISIEDKKIFLELKQRGEGRKNRSLERAKNDQEKEIIKALDKISDSIEESLKKQESLY